MLVGQPFPEGILKWKDLEAKEKDGMDSVSWGFFFEHHNATHSQI